MHLEERSNQEALFQDTPPLSPVSLTWHYQMAVIDVRSPFRGRRRGKEDITATEAKRALVEEDKQHREPHQALCRHLLPKAMLRSLVAANQIVAMMRLPS